MVTEHPSLEINQWQENNFIRKMLSKERGKAFLEHYYMRRTQSKLSNGLRGRNDENQNFDSELGFFSEQNPDPETPFFDPKTVP